MPILASGLLLVVPALSAWAMPETRRASSTRPPDLLALAPPSAPPLLLKPVSRTAAVDINRAIPFSTEPNVLAEPFRFAGDQTARQRATACLAAAVYYEAGNESEDGKRAVAQVVLNRVRHPAFPSSVCGVVFEGSTLPTGCQFTFTCDGSLLRIPERTRWGSAWRVADLALGGSVFGPVGLSTHYHADYVVPYWSRSLAKAAQVGVHIFYRWPRAWGELAAFRSRYKGVEPDPQALRTTALLAHSNLAVTGDDLSDAGIELTTNPEIEAIGIIRTLALSEDGSRNRYVKDVKSYFATFANDPAVQLMRTGAGSTPGAVTAGSDSALAQALRQFGQTEDFRRFFAGHRPYYQKALGEAERRLGPAVFAWESYTGVPVRSRKLTVAVGVADPTSVCIADRLVADPFWAPDPAGSPVGEMFIRSGLSDSILKHPRAGRRAQQSDGGLTVDRALERQIVEAVFVRISALSKGGEQTGSKAGVREIADRLQYFERHRDLYPTLIEFLPELLKLRGAAATRSIAAGDGQDCAVTQVADAR